MIERAQMRRIAITRAVSPSIGRCELSHIARQPIDLAKARGEHEAYEAALERLGCSLVRLPEEPNLPDSVFVEDAAVVLDELAIVTRPGAASRRPETETVAAALAPFRSLVRIEPPATLDGGDVLLAGRTIWVGLTPRTSSEGIDALAEIAGPLGYGVLPVNVRGCLHLKSAATLVGDGIMLVNPHWVDPSTFEGFETIEVDSSEPFAANALRIGSTVVVPEAFTSTRRRLEARGIRTATVPAAELARAEGGVTCCSIVLEAN